MTAARRFLKGETMDNEKAYAVFIIVKDSQPQHWLGLIEFGRWFPSETAEHLRDNPPVAGDGTHIAAFVWDDGPPTGKLENTMPGSSFEHFSFAKVRLLGKEIVVGRYW